MTSPFFHIHQNVPTSDICKDIKSMCIYCYPHNLHNFCLNSIYYTTALNTLYLNDIFKQLQYSNDYTKTFYI